MKFIIYFLIIYASIFDSHASTFCEQEFTFLSKSNFGGFEVFWIVESLNGECEYSIVHEIIIDDQSVQCYSFDFKEYSKWKNFHSGLNDFNSEDSELILPFNDTFQITSEINICKPDFNNQLSDEFSDIVSDNISDAIDWNRIKGLNGIQLPNISGINSELKFYYKRGLYINYNIDKIYYFKESGYVLIFTKQKMKADGMDTMDGFLIFQVF